MNRTCTFARSLVLWTVPAAMSLLAGCNAVQMASSGGGEPVQMASIEGRIHGGPNPIQHALVKLYVTQNNGYGGAAQVLTTTTSDTLGNFTLPGGTTCPAGQFAYIGVSGGNTGAQSANSNSLLMAALGSCETLFSGTTYQGGFVWVNEVTTAAAAYALSNFITIDTSGASPVINISAPANNNAASGCVPNSYYPSCTVTQTAGLAHAFANAVNLVNTSTGVANSALPTNASGSAPSIIPVAELNSLGNLQQACVNTTGGTAGDNSGCGNLFSYTTVDSVAPTNTLQAMLNIVKHPLQNVSNLYSLASAQSFFQPALSSAPPDWAVSVYFPMGNGQTTTTPNPNGLTYPWLVTLDINDNVYITNNNAASASWENLMAYKNDGTPLWSNATDTGAKFSRYLTADAQGHIFVPNNSTGSGAIIRVYDSTNGTLLETLTAAVDSPLGLAVDPQDNLWYTSSSGTAGIQNIQRFQYTGTTAGVPQYTTSTFTNAPSADQPLYQITLDKNGNVWAQGNSTSGPKMYLFPNTGTLGSPAYNGTLKQVSLAGNETNGYGLTTDANGKGWAIVPQTSSTTAANANIYPITATGSGDAITLSAGTPFGTGTSFPRFLSMDGAGMIWFPDFSGAAPSFVYGYDTVSDTALGQVHSCNVSTSAPYTCGTTASTASLSGNRNLAIDSAGNIWATSSGNPAAGSTHGVVEIIGLAAPTWPLRSLLKFGRPQ